MEKKKRITEMMFRIDTSKYFKGTVFAIMPYNIETREGHILTYQHVGQHSAGDYTHLLTTSKPASEEQYRELKLELEKHCGYGVKVIKKRNYKKYLKAWKQVKEWYSV